jgi:tetratricopeptide (TPR) repeat protein
MIAFIIERKSIRTQYMANLEQYIHYLKSSDSDIRREAIIALGRTQNRNALLYLERVAAIDPDPELRELAAKAATHVKQNSITPLPAHSPEIAPPIDPDAIWTETLVPDSEQNISDMFGEALEKSRTETQQNIDATLNKAKKTTVSSKDQKIARGHLQYGIMLHSAEDYAAALAELDQTLKLDPTLAGDSAALNLASSLMGLPPKEAIARVLKRAPEQFIKPNPSLEIDRKTITYWLILLGELPILFIVLNVLSIIVSSKFLSRAISINLDVMRQTAPSAGLLLVSALAGILAAYFVGMSMGGEAGPLHFLVVMNGVQIVVGILSAIAFSVIPIINIVRLSPTQSAASIHLGWAFVCLVGYLSWQGFFAFRVHRLQTIGQGIGLVLAGNAVAIFLARAFGLFKGFSIG